MVLASCLRYDCHGWYLVSREDYVAIGESLFSKQVTQGVVFLVQLEDRSVGSACAVSFVPSCLGDVL